MSYRGTVSSRRKIEPLPIPQTAGPALREQAIKRTFAEVQHPHRVWGIEGRLGIEFRSSGRGGASLMAGDLSREAEARLNVLKRVHIGCR